MATTREVTQVVVEVLNTPIPERRVSQVVVEVLNAEVIVPPSGKTQPTRAPFWGRR